MAQMNIKDWVRLARTNAALTQEQLADVLDCTKANVSAWENGRHEPSFTQMMTISVVSGTPLPCDAMTNFICDMKTFGERVRDRRIELGMTQGELAKASGMKGQSGIGNIEAGRNSGARALASLARALKVNALWLEKEEGPKEISSSGLDLNVSEGPMVGGEVPVISWVQAGNWEAVVDNFQPGHAEEHVTATVQVRRHTYALRVHGDSMEPDFREGDILIVEPEMEAGHGSLVIVKNGENEATFKKLMKDGGDWYLKPLNTNYPMKLMDETMRIVGVVRQRVSKFC